MSSLPLPQPSLPERILIFAGWLIDGSGGPVQRDRLLEIASGHILSIKPINPDQKNCPGLIDLSGCTLLPGLVDCHVHLFMSGTVDPAARSHQLQAPFNDIRDVIKRHLVAQLACGVLALRDGGDYAAHTLRYKTECLSSEEIPVHIRSAGKAWHAPGRYGSLIGRPPLKGYTLAQSIRNVKEAVDHVKLVNSGLNSLTLYGRETPPQFSLDQLKEAVQAACSLGLKTMVHANGKRAVGLALQAGCHSIEHGFFMGRENLEKMAESGIPWVPTLFPMEAYSRMLKPGSQEAETAKRNLEHQLTQIRTALEYGVTIAVGTDAGSLGVHHGSSVLEEIKLLLSAGLPLEKALQSATSNGAALLDLEKEMGILKPGMPATLIVTKGAPDNLMDALVSPERIYIRGENVAFERAVERLIDQFLGNGE